MEMILPVATRGNRAVANWILLGVFMLIVQIILGGITRLTGSGLSITEWNVITGAIPPLTEHQWVAEFEKYRQTSQFRYLHQDFTLSDFQFIFFWEWVHRLWARLIGVAFIVGFIYLLWKKYLKNEMIKPLLILFLLGALQGAVGWIMVASGLTGDAIYVEPTKLAFHFIFAIVLISYAFWFALVLRVPTREKIEAPGLRNWSFVLILLLLLQLLLGALMAGNKAATAAPTWPTINGSWIPAGLFRDQPVMLNFISNKITIHFFHRGLAYLLLVLIFIFTVKAFQIAKTGKVFIRTRRIPLLLVLVQVTLGILSVLLSPGIVANHWGAFEWMAELHQVTGMLLLLSLIAMLYLTTQSSFKQPS
jgi:cytochrome c oxidase assembly protein subunit 15